MLQNSVTSKGQVTIPKAVRQKLGIRKGSKVSFEVVGNHIELTVCKTPVKIKQDGFGLLKTHQKSVAVDFDPAQLLQDMPKN